MHHYSVVHCPSKELIMGVAKVKLICLVILIFGPLTRSQLNDNPCKSLNSCGECTNNGTNNCVWCYQLNFAGNRCINRNENTECAQNFLINTRVTITNKKDNILTEAKGSEDPIQIKPQHVSMTNVRVGKIYTVPVEFKQAKDYPIDLYILMDLSGSMDDDKANLERLSNNLADKMRSITKYFSIGFGSFADKAILPFSANMPDYCFKNHMSLADNIEQFKNEVKRAKIFHGGDGPESGFEALVQVIKCNQIRWREKARKILILATDNYSHLAGDGKLAGILTPNDGECHLDKSGLQYTYDLKQDYPSLGLISRLVQDHSINVIFAVTSNFSKEYEDFVPKVRGSSVAKLTKDSSNIVSLVEDQYKLITSSVELRDNATDDVKVRYFTRCLKNQTFPMEENSTCTELQVGSQVKYEVQIEVKRCPVGKNKHTQTIEISPVGLTDSLLIDLEIECECPCERADNVTCSSQCHDIVNCIECDPAISDSQDPPTCGPQCQFLNISKGDVSSFDLFPWRKCEIIDDITKCRRDIVYGFDSNSEKVIRYSNKNCPSTLTPVSITFMTMGLVVAVGFALLLLWRLLVFLYDRKEYARFINESQNAKWNTENNPLYAPASSNFQNPSFQGRRSVKL